jgi:hypothetical protein
VTVAGPVVAALLALAAEPVKLTVKQEYADGAHATVGVEAIARAFLSGAGLKPQAKAPLHLSIELHGDAVGTDYKSLQTGRTFEKFTYATIDGSHALTRDGQEVATAYFYGRSSVFSDSLPAAAYATRSQAPYQKAVDASNFIASLADTFETVLDSPRRVAGLEAISKAKLPDETKVAALCRMTRETDASAVEKLVAALKARKLGFESAKAVESVDARELCLVAFARLRQGLSTDDERDRLAKKYAACLGPGQGCGYDNYGGWCGTEKLDDLGVLTALGAPVVAELIALVKRYDRPLQEKAAERLGALKATAAVEPLIKLAKDRSDAGVRLKAIEALGAIGDPAAREVLESLARDDEDASVKKSAERALLKLPAAASE